MNYESYYLSVTITVLNHEEHTVLFPSPVGPITLKLVSSEIKKSMVRFARNHDVS